jgi:hypothetical protein
MVLMVSLSSRISPDTVTVIFFREVAAGDGGGHLGDVAHLGSEVGRHGIHVVGQVLPRAGDTGHLRLAAQASFGADLARHSGHFAGKGVQLVHHGVHGLLEFENFAGHIHRDLARQVAARHGGGHLRDVAHLRGQVAAHGVHRVGEILPRAGDTGHQGLSAQFALGTDLARHARHLGGEGAQLVHHGIDGFFQLQNFAAHVHGNFFGQIAIGNGDGDLSDVAHLRGQVRRHGVHALSEILPNARHFAHLGLAAQLAVGADLARHASHLGCEYRQLLDHGVDDVRGAQELTFERAAVDIERYGLQQITARHRGHGARHRRGGPQEVVDQVIDRAFHARPGAVG